MYPHMLTTVRLKVLYLLTRSSELATELATSEELILTYMYLFLFR